MSAPGKRNRIWMTIGLIVAIATLLSTDYAQALLKSKSHFVQHSIDARVRYEPGAEQYADALADDLGDAVARVEEIHGVPFKKAFTVYMCATQASLNEYVANPPHLPVRGTVPFGNVLIAPSAFHWHGEDTHKGTLRHELSHLLLKQYLGEIKNRTIIPVWFSEGLADVVCDCAGEGISDETANRAIMAGRRFIPDTNNSLFKVKRASDYGMDYPMFHRQSHLLVAFMRDTYGSAFQALLADIHSGTSFDRACGEHLDVSPDTLWEAYIANISQVK